MENAFEKAKILNIDRLIVAERVTRCLDERLTGTRTQVGRNRIRRHGCVNDEDYQRECQQRFRSVRRGAQQSGKSRQRRSIRSRTPSPAKFAMNVSRKTAAAGMTATHQLVSR